MAWEWSQTREAYADAYVNLCGLPIKILAEIYAEWAVRDAVNTDDDVSKEGWSASVYRDSIREAKSTGIVKLCDYIWQRATSQRTCTTGGHKAWLCPYGCGCHMADFTRVDKNVRLADRRGLL